MSETHRQMERWAGRAIPDLAISRLCAVVDGLRSELVAASPLMSFDQAEEILRGELDTLRSSAAA